MRCRGRPDGNEDAAADALDDPAGDQLVESLSAPRDCGSDDEDDKRAEEQPAGSPDIREATGKRHGDDIRQQVAVDDP